MQSMEILQQRKSNLKKSGQGRWSKIQHQKFLQSLKLFGKNWKKIQQYIGTRTGAQIRSHSQKFFSRLQKQIKQDLNTNIQDQTHKENNKIQVIQNQIISTKNSIKELNQQNVQVQPLIDNSATGANIVNLNSRQSFFQQFFNFKIQQDIITTNVFDYVDLKSKKNQVFKSKISMSSSFQEYESQLMKYLKKSIRF